MVLPLLGDSEILTALSHRLGLVGYEFAQVVSFDDPPIILSDEQKDAQIAVGAIVCVPESILLEKRGRPNSDADAKLKWRKQTIQNTCGTVALLNLGMNLVEGCQDVEDDKLLVLHEEFAGKEDSEGEEEEIEMHFVAIYKSAKGRIYELDGRNSSDIRLLSTGSILQAIRDEYLSACEGMMSAFLVLK